MGVFSSKCASTVRLDGKTAIITGCNTGIGKVTVQDFFRRGARVIMACRNEDKAEEAANDIKTALQNVPNLGQIVITQLDLTSLKSVRSCATRILEKEDKIDLLINNAGVMMCPYGKTEDGFEIQFGTNHLGHFLFTLLLLPKIIKSTPARIVNVSSVAGTAGSIYWEDLNWDKKPYSAIRAYAQSKLANVLFTKELAAKLKENEIQGVNVYSLHPGVIATELGRHVDETYLFKGAHSMIKPFYKVFAKTPLQGAQTTIYCAVDEKVENETGLYYAECNVANPGRNGKKEEDAKRLWDVSLKLVGLDKNYNPFQVL